MVCYQPNQAFSQYFRAYHSRLAEICPRTSLLSVLISTSKFLLSWLYEIMWPSFAARPRDVICTRAIQITRNCMHLDSNVACAFLRCSLQATCSPFEALCIHILPHVCTPVSETRHTQIHKHMASIVET